MKREEYNADGLDATRKAGLKAVGLTDDDQKPLQVKSCEIVDFLPDKSSRRAGPKESGLRDVAYSQEEMDCDADTFEARHPLPFPQKLMQMIQWCELQAWGRNKKNPLVWTPDGRAFEIVDPGYVIRILLPKFFNKKTQFESFRRKLYRWGFRQVSGTVFASKDFQRDKPENCQRMEIRYSSKELCVQKRKKRHSKKRKTVTEVCDKPRSAQQSTNVQINTNGIEPKDNVSCPLVERRTATSDQVLNGLRPTVQSSMPVLGSSTSFSIHSQLNSAHQTPGGSWIHSNYASFLRPGLPHLAMAQSRLPLVWPQPSAVLLPSPISCWTLLVPSSSSWVLPSMRNIYPIQSNQTNGEQNDSIS